MSGVQAAWRPLLELVLAASLVVPVEAFDRAVQARVQDGRRPWLEPVMRGATAVGRPPVVLGAVFVVALAAGAPGLAFARTLVVALVPVNLAVEGLKRTVQRVRPDGRFEPHNASFPSSHAANAFAIAVVIAARRRRWLLPCLALAALVSFSRVYLNRHFASDVLVGAALGALGGAWAVFWSRGAGRRWIWHRLGGPPGADPAARGGP